jgi:chemotaxis protein MotB
MGKKKCPPCAEGAPAWLATYGDMVTLMLCVFVMIFTTGKSTPQEAAIILSAFNNSLGFFTGGQTLSKGKMEEMGMNLESMPSMTKGRSLSKAKKQAREIFKPEIQSRKVAVTEDERGIVISLIGADYFEPGSALINPSIEEVLRKASLLFKDLDRFVRIEGHSAAGEESFLAGAANTGRSERTYMNSWDLASARAVNISVYLQDQGVPPSLLQAISYGQYRPLDMTSEEGTPEAKAHSRRVDLVIIPEKDPKRSESESKYRLPESRIPTHEYQIKD